MRLSDQIECQVLAISAPLSCIMMSIRDGFWHSTKKKQLPNNFLWWSFSFFLSIATKLLHLNQWERVFFPYKTFASREITSSFGNLAEKQFLTWQFFFTFCYSVQQKIAFVSWTVYFQTDFSPFSNWLTFMASKEMNRQHFDKNPTIKYHFQCQFFQTYFKNQSNHKSAHCFYHQNKWNEFSFSIAPFFFTEKPFYSDCKYFKVNSNSFTFFYDLKTVKFRNIQKF